MCQRNPELRNCSCSLSYIAFDLDEIWRPMYSINCSNLNLYRLPASVPENTTTFYATNNNVKIIACIRYTFENRSYFSYINYDQHYYQFIN